MTRLMAASSWAVIPPKGTSGGGGTMPARPRPWIWAAAWAGSDLGLDDEPPPEETAIRSSTSSSALAPRTPIVRGPPVGRVQGSDALRPLGFGPTVSSVAKPAVPHVLMTASDSAPRRPVGRRGRPSRHAWGALALVAAAAASLSSAPGAGARRAHRARVRPVILDARCLPPGKCEPDGRHV